MRGALSSQAAILMVVRYRFKFSIELNLEPAFPNIPTATISSHYGPGRCRVWLQILLGNCKSMNHVRMFDFGFWMTVWSFSILGEKILSVFFWPCIN